ncbi:MAG: cytochrome P450 [Bacteroidota bacterium]
MQKALFRHSDIQDPYSYYTARLRESPLLWDKDSGAWVIYGYASCKQLLQDSRAEIPGLPPAALEPLNEVALRLVRNLVRLKNAPSHVTAREITSALFTNRVQVSIPDSMEKLLPPGRGPFAFDWMVTVANKLPVLILAESLGFSPADSGRILDGIGDLVRILSPFRTDEQVMALNRAAEEIYLLTERHLADRGIFDSPESYVSNLVGLFIQSYDAGRGLLGNSLVQCLQQGDLSQLRAGNKDYISRCVRETLRYDPPVHHTRRVLISAIELEDITLQKGELIVLMLAAGNRDDQQFAQPEIFDPFRENLQDILTFGSGAHECMAHHFSVHMATEALHYLFQAYKNIELVEKPGYEPLMNVRVPRQLLVGLS